MANDRNGETTMLRAKITREQVRELRRLAFEAETTMQDILGTLIEDYIAKHAKAPA